MTEVPNRINLHAHTRYSDGSNTIRDMAVECRFLKFSACVITDHVYPLQGGRSPDVSMDLQKFVKALTEANKVSKELHYPIILGAEFVVNQEEILVYGTDAILYLLRIRDEIGCIGVHDLRVAREKYLCATIMAHPHRPHLWAATDVLDGYELFNNGAFQFSHGIPLNFEGLTPFSNSDAHDDVSLALSWNRIDWPIYNELALVKFIKEDCPVAHHVVPWRTLADVFLESERQE
jgi:hypothetical protein